MIKVGILGADGSMGKIIARLAIEDENMQLSCAYTEINSPNIGTDAGTLIGKGKTGVLIEDTSNLEEKLEKAKPDVLIDFTMANATEINAPIAISKKIKMVIGTTGLSDDFINKIEKLTAQMDTPIIVASNMAVGMNLFINTVKQVARMLKGWDIEIIEAHHHRKRDAPSGTAITIARSIAEVLNKNLDDIAKYGRQRGPNPRKIGEQEIGIHAIRAGDIVGDHTVLFAGPGERIELVHRAHDRSCFASGAITAAKFLYSKNLKGGIYSMSDVLGM
ncbi:MAG: 4-hydroxy-tetrahydrodipicolinate reductase [Promethearchaeota archaeon]